MSELGTLYMNCLYPLWPYLKAAVEATAVSIEIAMVGTFIAWRQLSYAKKRDNAIDIRNSWEKIHKAMLKFRFRRVVLNHPSDGARILAWLSEAIEALYKIKGQLDRTPDSPLVIEIANFLDDHEEAEKWRSDAFAEGFDKFVHEAALRSR